MKKKTDAELAKSLYERAVKHDYFKPATKAELENDLAEKGRLIEELVLKIKLREKLIDEQRQHIEILKAELNKKKWWRLWR